MIHEFMNNRVYLSFEKLLFIFVFDDLFINTIVLITLWEKDMPKIIYIKILVENSLF